MNRPPALVLALALAAAAAGCDTGFDPQYRVTDVRILAVAAEVVGSGTAAVPPWADILTDSTIQLRALVANPRGRPTSVRWYTCAPAATGAVTPCIDQEVLKDPALLADLATRPNETGVFLVGQGETPPRLPLSSLPAQVRAALDAAVDAVVENAIAQPTFQCSVYVEVPIVVVVEGNGVSEVALKRVRLTRDPLPPELIGPEGPTYLRNRNPRVTQVFRTPQEPGCGDATTLDEAFPMGLTTLCAHADRAEGFNICGEAGVEAEVGEALERQWFATAGEFPEFTGVGNADESQPEFERPPGAFTLWVVVRDGRGGVAWTRRDVAAAP